MSSTVLTFFISRSVKFFFLLFIFFFAETFQLRAQDTAVLNPLQPNYYVDFDQRRIDLLDGTADHKINLGDSSANEYADRVYFVLVDSIQRFIDSKQFDATQKKLFREALYTQLKRVTLRTVSSVKRYDNVLHFMLGELKSIQQHKLYDYLVTNISQAFNTIDVFKNEMSADSFFVFAAYYHPDWVLANYYKYANQPYSLHVLEACSKIAPVTVKRYFNPNDPIYDALKRSNDTVIKILLKIKDVYTRKSNAFTLIDAIANGKISMEQADSIGNNSEAYLREMLQIRAQKNPLGVHSLDDDLTIYSLKYIRVLNDLHNEKDDIRFASIKNFSDEEMYTLIVYSEEEIFTSTFNGLFNRMMIKLGAVSGYEFLNELGDNRFRTFIKMAAGFGKLKPLDRKSVV